jgi:DNA polymerase-3 subunit alpha
VITDYAWLQGATEGLIALSGGRDGEIGRQLLNQHADQARRCLDDWQRLFPERFYLALSRTGRVGEAGYIDAAIELALASDTPVVATNDVRFLAAEDFEAHEARVCVHQGKVLADPNRPKDYSVEQYLRSPAEMAELFADVPEALANSVEIARRCNLQFDLGHSLLPDSPVPAGLSTAQHLQQRAQHCLEQRLAQYFEPTAADFAQRRQPYDERLHTELQVINQMGFPGYFLIVADFIQWARDNQIPVGPGRGSGAGSLVAYALGITDLDPLEYDLLFERFLNPERVSMPDFDIDFCMERRDRVIDYVAQRYGRDRVAQIATHGTMAAKAVVRDVGRVLGHPYPFVDRIAKLIPFKPGVHISLEQAMEQEEELRRLYQDDEEIRYLIDLARKLEGLARSVGKHAGGVVIAPSALTDFSPLYCEPDSDSTITHFDKDDVEAIGLVKFDFLGLRTLTIIDWALEAINTQRGETQQPPLDINRISLADEPTFALLKRCQTTAIFQLESRGMKDLIRRLQPDRFEDIIALVALFRPGPLQSGMVDDFIDRKHGRAHVEYPHPELEPILEPTYGVILYQEQVMQIAQVLAGYSLGAADLLRRAMGKKKPEEMAKQRSVFVQGATGRGVDAELATFIFDLMEKFAGYGFNRSHSAAYALLSYQTAWLKAHYPAAFMAAVLSSDMDNTDKVVISVDECRSMGLPLRSPAINHSQYRFTADTEHGIRYGLGAIKGVGESAIEHIVSVRDQSGAFHDLLDLCRRVDLRRINRRVLEALIRAGACDELGRSRAVLMAQLPEALALAEQDARSVDQLDIFGAAAEPLTLSAVEVPEWDDTTRLRAEKQTLGLYLSGHPLDAYRDELDRFITTTLAELLKTHHRGERQVVTAGLVLDTRVRHSQRGGRMAFITLDDRNARMEVRVFAELYEQVKLLLKGDAPILVITGKLSYDEFNQRQRLTAEQIHDIDGAREHHARRLRLCLEASQFNNGLLAELSAVLQPHRQGQCPVWIDYRRPGAQAEFMLDDAWRIRPSDALLHQLRQRLGSQHVRVDYR